MDRSVDVRSFFICATVAYLAPIALVYRPGWTDGLLALLAYLSRWLHCPQVLCCQVSLKSPWLAGLMVNDDAVHNGLYA
jgi:hypothetical protein